MEVKEKRLLNLRRLVEKAGSRTALSDKLDIPVTHLNIYIGKTPARNIGEHFARKAEKKLNLPEGWLDQEHFDEKENKPEKINPMIAAKAVVPYTQVDLVMKYVDMAYGLRHLKNEAKSFIFKEMLDDQKRYILPSDVQVLIKDILEDETKLLLAWEVLHNLDFARKIFMVINQE